MLERILARGDKIATSVKIVEKAIENLNKQGESLKSGLKEVGSTISSRVLSAFQTAKLFTVRGACILELQVRFFVKHSYST